MKYRSHLTRSLLAASLLTASLHAVATERVYVGSTGTAPLSAIQAQGDRAARAAAADGLITARINGAPFVATKAFAYESVFQLDGRRYLGIEHGPTERGRALILSIPVKNGDSHVRDGHYEFGLPTAPPEGVKPEMALGEPVDAPPPFVGFAVFNADSGWIDLKFNADRTRLDATFEFEAAGEEFGDRIIRKGSFSMPYTDLPDSVVPEA
ncbi:hypothetical protein [Luteibacter sp. E-22]|uniref:hypothetical protein n=1 Tax=Luteibacter sp. E-22 TaxID=3404050 RepID=UPI003CF3BE3B